MAYAAQSSRPVLLVASPVGIESNASPPPLVTQVFMNERDGLASGMIGRSQSQVENYTFGILSTVRVE